ncbi:MAG: LAGLIDADG family homing endonuclease [Candidatus Diapherotrites archaeon]|nr:LAGLIDADG family homing endonuclease [Candidatus Diapherotrites archaeon]
MESRIKLKPNYQRKLIETAKNNLTWEELGKKLNISGTYLKRDLRYERILLTENNYNALCKLSRENYDNYILKKLESNWGQSKGGKNSIHKPKGTKLLTTERSKELAEIIGIMLGDGNVWSRKGFYYTRIAGHSIDDKDYLLNFVNPLFKKTVSIDMGTYYSKTSKEMFLTKGSKDLVYTLEHYGFKNGNKKKNNLGIPKWVFDSDDYIKACIRGLIDTDGSVSPITGRNYTYIWFRSSIPNLRKTFSKAMEILDIRIAKWSGGENAQTFIGSKSAILNYYKEIGFNNSKHNGRFFAPVV